MPPPRHLTSLFRRARTLRGLLGMAALGLVVAGGVSFALATTVEVSVEDRLEPVRAFGELTVAEALERAQVTLAAGDAVEPPLDSVLQSGDVVDVERAITVEVVVDGGTRRHVTAPVSTVAGVLETASLTSVRTRGASIVPAWHAPVQDGDLVMVRLPVPVRVEVDGGAIELETLGTSIASALHDAGVEVGEDDLVFPPAPAPVRGAVTVSVKRVDVSTETVDVELDAAEVRRESADLRRGTTRVEQQGAPGLRRDTYEVTHTDGVQTARRLLGSETVTEPVDRVVVVGTRVPPAPTTSSTATGSVWDRLARCESRGNWAANTGNGYYGGLQFHPQTWRGVGGTGLPHQHPREVQIEMGKRLQARSGWGQWPACSRKIGLR